MTNAHEVEILPNIASESIQTRLYDIDILRKLYCLILTKQDKAINISRHY